MSSGHPHKKLASLFQLLSKSKCTSGDFSTQVEEWDIKAQFLVSDTEEITSHAQEKDQGP